MYGSNGDERQRGRRTIAESESAASASPSIESTNSIQSLNSLVPLSVPSSSVIVSNARVVLHRDAHLVQSGLELVNFGLLNKDVLLVKFLDDVFVIVFAVNVYQHGFDGSIALDERS